jgi:hypothetical protein
MSDLCIGGVVNHCVIESLFPLGPLEMVLLTTTPSVHCCSNKIAFLRIRQCAATCVEIQFLGDSNCVWNTDCTDSSVSKGSNSV